MKLEDQAMQKKNPAEEKSPQLDVLWKSKQGSQEQYKGSSILTTPHHTLAKEKSRALKMEMVGKSARRCRDKWKNHLSL